MTFLNISVFNVIAQNIIVPDDSFKRNQTPTEQIDISCSRNSSLPKVILKLISNQLVHSLTHSLEFVQITRLKNSNVPLQKTKMKYTSSIQPYQQDSLIESEIHRSNGISNDQLMSAKV